MKIKSADPKADFKGFWNIFLEFRQIEIIFLNWFLHHKTEILNKWEMSVKRFFSSSWAASEFLSSYEKWVLNLLWYFHWCWAATAGGEGGAAGRLRCQVNIFSIQIFKYNTIIFLDKIHLKQCVDIYFIITKWSWLDSQKLSDYLYSQDWKRRQDCVCQAV